MQPKKAVAQLEELAKSVNFLTKKLMSFKKNGNGNAKL